MYCRFISSDLEWTDSRSLKLIPILKKLHFKYFYTDSTLFQGCYVGWMRDNVHKGGDHHHHLSISHFYLNYNKIIKPKYNTLMVFLLEEWTQIHGECTPISQPSSSNVLYVMRELQWLRKRNKKVGSSEYVTKTFESSKRVKDFFSNLPESPSFLLRAFSLLIATDTQADRSKLDRGHNHPS